MNMEGLRLFCLVADEGSISQAARLSFVSQPAVTRQIRQLEEAYNAQLFDRSAGKLTLSEAGRELYPYAKEIIHYLRKSEEAVQEITDPAKAVLHIGASHTIGEYLLPKLLGDFTAQHTAIRFSLSIANTPTIMTMLEDNEIDIAFVEGIIENEELIKERFRMDELILVVSSAHRWSDRASISIEELPEEKMIWREERSGTRSFVEDALRERGVLDKITGSLELGSYQSIKSAVEAELGVSILPKLTVLKELEFGTLHELAIEKFSIARELHIVQKQQRFKKGGLTQFVSYIRARYNLET